MNNPSIHIELIAHGKEQKQEIPLSIHVTARCENFIYANKKSPLHTGLSYYETIPIDAWRNIQLLDQTHLIPANNLDLIADEITWEKINSHSYTSKYKSIAITNQVIIDRDGNEKPLFYRHILPLNTIDVNVEVSENGNRHDVDSGFKLEETPLGLQIYTNYQNFYNPDTGAYRLYFVSSSDEKGNVTREMLNPVPAVGQATWEDLEPGTGKVKNLSWSMEPSTSGFAFTIHPGDTVACDPDDILNYYIKPLETSVIKPLLPSGRSPEDPWNIKFTNGLFYELILGRMRKYWIPEYHRQPFSPNKPYIYSPYRKMLRVTKRTLVATRKYIAIDPYKAMHFTLYEYDADKVLTSVYTTDKSLDGTRFADTEVFYEADKIISWDNRNGFIHFATDMDANSFYYASYFYEAEDYEYKDLTLNPLQNRNSLSNMWVFYIIPDCHPEDRAIHYISVDEHGYINYASQGEGRKYKNFGLFNKDGSYNEDTVVGMKYTSMIDSQNFKTIFCVPYINDYQYYILGEVMVRDIGDVEDSLVFDIRKQGAVIKDKYFKEAIHANPRILQSYLGYGFDGQIVPKNNVMYCDVDITTLEAYGGVMSPDVAEDMLRTYLPAADSIIVDWSYIKPKFEGSSLVEGQVDLTMTWEGPDLIYNIYRRKNPSGEWKLIHSIENPLEGEINYSDIRNEENDLKSERVYYYSLRVVANSVELPHGDMLGIMVK